MADEAVSFAWDFVIQDLQMWTAMGAARLSLSPLIVKGLKCVLFLDRELVVLWIEENENGKETN